jgi:hypothetical protein
VSGPEDVTMSTWKKVLVWLLVALFVTPFAMVAYVFGGWLLVFWGVLWPWQFDHLCLTDTLIKAENIGGFDFEFEEVNCDVVGNRMVQMIFVSRHGQAQRHRLVAYINDSNEPHPPVASLLAPRTVRLSLGTIEGIYTSDDHWRDLRVTYGYEIRRKGEGPVPPGN